MTVGAPLGAVDREQCVDCLQELRGKWLELVVVPQPVAHQAGRKAGLSALRGRYRVEPLIFANPTLIIQEPSGVLSWPPLFISVY
jgi:hypothetical protein